jgi:predicted O-linked N-acetylglucosamine transferase (SPINDLY family)
MLGKRDLRVDRRGDRVGEMMQSRVAAGLIEAVGLPELIVDSLKEYEELVVALATGQTGDRPMEASRARL